MIFYMQFLIKTEKKKKRVLVGVLLRKSTFFVVSYLLIKKKKNYSQLSNQKAIFESKFLLDRVMF